MVAILQVFGSMERTFCRAETRLGCELRT
ncbi:hypothetical protein PSCLAVI8L_100190 [Pseudoclavibacter sp. 8L]|nr:hypothetical protein PSCLAVI8L_100190 [Pseudoclavibacter sp. 8L]